MMSLGAHKWVEELKTLVDETAHDRADEFVSSMDVADRVTWLRHEGFTDARIIDGLLNEDDPELDELTRDHAHGIAASFNNGSLDDETPEWLQ